MTICNNNQEVKQPHWVSYLQDEDDDAGTEDDESGDWALALIKQKTTKHSTLKPRQGRALRPTKLYMLALMYNLCTPNKPRQVGSQLPLQSKW